MVKSARFLGYLFFFIGALLFFLPKVQLYYLAEEALHPLAIVISEENVEDSGFSLNIQESNVIFQGIPSAKIADISLMTGILYNTLDIKDVTLNEALKTFVPLHIEKAHVTYALYRPTSVKGFIMGEFGEAQCELDLLSREIRINLTPSARMQKEFAHTLRYFKKDENGGYVYAKTI